MAKSLLLLLLLAIAFRSNSPEAQLLDCYFQHVNLVPCLTSGAAGNMSEVCCQALNQALSTGQQCLCSILFSTNLFLDSHNPIPTSPQGIELPGCILSMPSLSSCQGMPDIKNSPATDPDLTVPTLAIPTASTLINNTLDSRDISGSEGSDSMDVVSQLGKTDHAGASSSGEMKIISHVLSITCILLVMSEQALFSLK